MTRYTYLTMLIPGGQEALDRALRECAEQNGGRVVGNPSTLKYLSGQVYKGQVVSALIVDTLADPQGWWAEYKRVHGWHDFGDESPESQ